MSRSPNTNHPIIENIRGYAKNDGHNSKYIPNNLLSFDYFNHNLSIKKYFEKIQQPYMN